MSKSTEKVDLRANRGSDILEGNTFDIVCSDIFFKDYNLETLYAKSLKCSLKEIIAVPRDYIDF